MVISVMLLLALICFLLATFNIAAPINLTALGLAFVVLSQGAPLLVK